MNSANEYFFSCMKKVYVDRVYIVESFEQYLRHRYRTNCYFYSGYAVMGMKADDRMVRGDICLDHDWMWCNGGYGHGWVEFLYDGEEFVFDSMCESVMAKELWYKKFRPQNIVSYTHQEILKNILLPSNCRLLPNGFYEIAENLAHEDRLYKLKPYQSAEILLTDGIVERFIAHRDPFS